MEEPYSHVMRYSRWQAFGVCANMPLNDRVFFSEPGRPRNNRLSKPYCDECPVQQLCLEDSLVHGDKYGVWGGLDSQQRKLFATTHKEYVLSLIRRAIEENWFQETRIEYAPKWMKTWVEEVQRSLARELQAQDDLETLLAAAQSALTFENFPEFSLHTAAS